MCLGFGVPGGSTRREGKFSGSSWRSLVWLRKGQPTGSAAHLIFCLSEASFLLLSNEEGPTGLGTFRDYGLLCKDSEP